MHLHQHLDWDSQFFGWPVARLPHDHLPAPVLRALLAQLRRDGYRLVYWAAAAPSQEALLGPWRARLVDRKVTYTRDLPKDPIEPPCPLQSATPDIPQETLEALAIQSGHLSRFKVDPDIPDQRFEALYRLWMQNSRSRALADDVLVLTDQGQVAGVVTVADKEGAGDIGLISVDAAHRRKGYGRALVQGALRWAQDQGLARAQVVTQEDNRAACRLYEACGYALTRRAFVYHIWL
jgi:dTDP-4-amino-4,6-dideoxy-D-galactose acyltransferase